MTKNWNQALGKHEDSAEIKQFLESLGITLDDTEEKKTYKDGATYYCFYKLGVALCFTAKALSSVDFYKLNRRYSDVKPDLLPEGISLTSTGKELVDKFGEPLEKGGGRAKAMDIWLRWNNLEIQINDRDWDTAKNCSWSSLTVFRT
jgi:hypothetical protein